MRNNNARYPINPICPARAPCLTMLTLSKNNNHVNLVRYMHHNIYRYMIQHKLDRPGLFSFKNTQLLI